MQATRLRHGERSETLFYVLAIAFCWAWHVSAWQHTGQALRLKTHGRPALSVFRYGFDGLWRVVLKPDKGSKLERLLRLMWWKVGTLSKTLLPSLYPYSFVVLQ